MLIWQSKYLLHFKYIPKRNFEKKIRKSDYVLVSIHFEIIIICDQIWRKNPSIDIAPSNLLEILILL